MKRLLLYAFVISAYFDTLAQLTPEIDLGEFIESNFQVQDEDFSYDELYENLYQLCSSPINLNNASPTQIERLTMLSPYQQKNLQTYLALNSPLLSLYELQVIEGFDSQTLKKLLPFVIATPIYDHGDLLNDLTQRPNTYLILRTEKRLEHTANDFQGSPMKYYGRFRASRHNSYSIGLTFEKDVGEEFKISSRHNQYGFDFYSIHLMIENKWKIDRAILGDYQLQFGQGLIFGAGFRGGKGAETITTVYQPNIGISPYTSALESGFLRGVATTVNVSNNLKLTPFFSQLQQDALIQTDSTFSGFQQYVTSIRNTGLHRTAAELAAKNQINERHIGFNSTFTHGVQRRITIGVNVLHSEYSIAMIKRRNRYNQYDFKGTSNYNLGGFANVNWRNFLLFSEWAIAKSSATASIFGFLVSLNPKLSLSYSFRNYAKNYHALLASAFGESSGVTNESGQYWGIKYTPGHKLTFSAYYDHFSFPWLRYNADAPSEGYETLIRSQYESGRVKFIGQVRKEVKQVSIHKQGENLSTLLNGTKYSTLGQIEFKANEILTLKSRIQYSSYNLMNERSKGIAIMQDLNINLHKISISGRYALFDTDNFQNRQYAYERDVLYAFSIPAYSGQGIRNYILVKYKINRRLSIWGRYAQTRNFLGINNIESETSNRKNSHLKFQILCRL